MQSSKASAAGLFLAIFVLPTVASAECYVCDELIRLESSQAECFLSRYDQILDVISSAPRGRSAINLNVCTGGRVEGTRGGVIDLPNLPSEGNPPASQDKETKSVYLMDAAGVMCLRDLIEQYNADFDPAAEFDLYEQCSDG